MAIIEPSPLLSALFRLCSGRGNLQSQTDRDVLKLLAVTLGLSLFGWLAVILNAPVIGFDTTVYYLEEGNGELLHVIKTGRFMQALLLCLFPPLATAPAITGALLLLLLVFSGVVFTLLLSPSSRLTSREYLAAAFCVLFPYWQNFFYFNFAHVGYGCSILLSLIALTLLWRQPQGLFRMALAGLLVTLALGFYQSALHVFFCALCIAASLYTVRGVDIYRIFLVSCRSVIVALCSVCAYLLLHKMVIYMCGLNAVDSGGYTVTFDVSFFRFLENIPLQLSGNPVLLPFWQSNMLYGVGLLTCILLFKIISCGRYFFIITCLAASLLANIGLALVTSQGLGVRTTIGLAFFWSGMIMLTVFLPWQRIRRILCSIFAVFLLIFCFNITTSWRILNEVSEWDRIQAMQMKHDILRFASARNLSAPYNISIIGCIDKEGLPWPQDILSLTGFSMLSCFGNITVGQHPYGLFQRIGAKDFDFRPVRASDFRRVQGRSPWPAEDGIFEDEEGLAIWLGPVRRSHDLDEGFVALARSMGVRDASLLGGQAKRRPYNDWLIQEFSVNPQGPWTLPRGASDVFFVIDNTESLADDAHYVRVSGWVYDLPHCARPDMIFLLNANGEVVGFGHSGFRREDLGRRIASRAVYGGFIGYTLTGQSVARIVYFLDYTHLLSQ